MSEKQLKPLQFIPFYLLWIISGVLSVLDWLALRAAVTAVASAIADAVPMEAQIKRQWYLRWTVGAVDKFALAILGIAAMVSVMSFDYLYRDALIKEKAKKRFAIVTGIQVGLLIVSEIVILISSSTL